MIFLQSRWDRLELGTSPALHPWFLSKPLGHFIQKTLLF